MNLQHPFFTYSRIICAFCIYMLCFSVGIWGYAYAAVSVETLPGTEVTPEEMQKMFPAPLSRDAPHLDFIPDAAPLIPILPPEKTTVQEEATQSPVRNPSASPSPFIPAMPAMPRPVVTPQSPQETPSHTQLPLTMPQSSGSAGGNQSISPHVPSMPQMTQNTENSEFINREGGGQQTGHSGRQAGKREEGQKGIPAYPTIEIMVGQMIMAGFAGMELDTSVPLNIEGTSIIQLVRQGRVGGVFLQPVSLTKGAEHSMSGADYSGVGISQGNMTSPAQTLQLTSMLQRAASESATGIPLFVAVVQEGGLEQSLRPELGFEGLASAAHLGRGRVEETEIAARRNGLEMAAVGINFAFGPAGDVNINPLSEDIGKRFRSFGADPSLVGQHVAAFGRGLAAARVIPCVRNFPGTGSFVRGFSMGTVNTNMPNLLDGLPDVGRTWQRLEMIPYSHTLHQGWAGAVQPALAYVRSIDPLHPAPLSRTIISSILRGQLDFDGLVVTQDLRAMQPFYTLEESVVQAVLAGADIILVTEPLTVPSQGSTSPLSLFQENLLEGGDTDMKALLQQELLKHLPGELSGVFGARVQAKKAIGEATMAAKVYASLLSSVRNGRISVERLRQSWRRIVRMKQAFLYTTEPLIIP